MTLIDALLGLAIIVILVLLLRNRRAATRQEKYAEGYAYGLAMCDNPADRAEAEGCVQTARDFGEYNDFDRGVEDALAHYPNGLPRRP